MITPRVISLDLDDTLWPVERVLAAAEMTLLSWLRTHHPRAVHGHDLESMRRVRADIATRFPEQRHDMTFLRARALAEHFAAAGYPGMQDADFTAGARPRSAAAAAAAGSPLEHAMEVFFAARNRVELYADVRCTLERLRTRYRLFALSNGNADLKRCGIADLFDGHVTAASAGAAKPDARIFAQLVRMAGVDPLHVMHIGDDPLADVVGATQAGLQAVWLNRHARTWPAAFAPPPRTVSTLAELV